MKLIKKLSAVLISMFMIMNMTFQPLTLVKAENSDLNIVTQTTEDDLANAVSITGVTINQGEESQTISMGSNELINLPKINITLSDGTVESKTVTWESNKYVDVNVPGEYTYLPVLDTTINNLADGVELPSFILIVSNVTSSSVNENLNNNENNYGLMTITDGSETTDITKTRLSSTTFKEYVAGDPSTLWDYTNATTFSYQVDFIVESTETANRVFTIDINPNNIDGFPYMISGAPTIIGIESTNATFSDNNTELTYTVPVASLVSGIEDGKTTASAGFNIGISLNDNNASTTYGQSEGNHTFAAAIGNTILNDLDAKFGVTLDDSKTPELEDIRQRHVPNLYDIGADGVTLTPWTSYSIIGDTKITGVYGFEEIHFDRIAESTDPDNGIYSLWLGANGSIYFGDGETFANSSNQQGKITTTIKSNLGKQLPIDGLSYTTYNTLNTFMKKDDIKDEIIIVNGDSNAISDTFDYKNSLMASPFSKGFQSNEHHYFAGSLPTANAGSLSVDIRYLNAIIPSNTNLETLKESGVEYITVPSSAVSTISYRQLTVDDNDTPIDASDDIYGIAFGVGKEGEISRTSIIPDIVINIPDYDLVDKLESNAGGDGSLVDDDTTTLSVELSNEFLDSRAEPDDPFSKTYANHTLTIEIPETFKVGQLKIENVDENEKNVFQYYRYYIGDVVSGKLDANWVNGVLQLPEGMKNLHEVDKIELYISPTGLTNGQFDGAGGNVTQDFEVEFNFTDCVLKKPNVEPNINGRYETTMPIYLSTLNDKDGTSTKLGNTDSDKNIDDLNIVWYFEQPGDPDQDNLTLTLTNTHTGNFNLASTNKVSSIFTAYITQQLENGKPMFNADSRVFKDVVITLETGQDNHLQLIRRLRINGTSNTWEFIPENTFTNSEVKNNVVIYYTTNLSNEEIRKPIDISVYTDFELKNDSEYLTSLRIEIDEMMLPKSSEQKNPVNFIDFGYADFATVSNGDLPISTTNLTDNLTIKMTAGNFDFTKEATAEETFAYVVPKANLNSINGYEQNSGPKHGQMHMLLDEDIVLNYHIQDTETTTITSELDTIKNINSDFPLGSAIYLQLNPSYFEYIGSEDENITRVLDKDGTTWLRYDISNEDGVGNVIIPKDTILVTGKLPEGNTSIFTNAYLDTSALLEVEFFQNNFIDYQITLSGTTDSFGVTNENNEYYDITSATTGLVDIYDSEGSKPQSLTISPLTSYAKVMTVNSQISTDGYLEYGTEEGSKNIIRYYAHESDDLELRILLGNNNEEVLNDVVVNIELPIDSSTMKIGLEGDIYDLLSPEQRSIVGSRDNITYYGIENPTSTIEPNEFFTNVKTAQIIIPRLEVSSFSALDIQLKAFESDVYSKRDNSQEDVIVSSTLTNNVEHIVSYIFDWYELSGIAYSEKSTDTQNGIYDGDDKYLDSLLIDSFEGLREIPNDLNILDYNSVTGKYSLLIQPKIDVYNLVYTPKESAYTVSEVLPATSLALNNNFNGTNGINFNANITEGMSIVVGEENLKQVEIDNGNVDLALIKTSYTVIFKENKEDKTNVDKYDDVLLNSTISTTKEYTVPADKELVGWTTDDTPGLDSPLWDFNDVGDDPKKDTKVEGNVVLYPVLKDKEIPTNTPESTSTPLPTNTPESTSTPLPTNTPESTSTPLPTNAPESTSTPLPTNTPESTSTPLPTTTPVVTSAPIPIATPVVTTTPIPTSTPLPTTTPIVSSTPKPTTTPVETTTPAPTIPTVLEDDDFTVEDNGTIVVDPEFTKDLPDGKYEIEVEVDGDYYEILLEVENGIPLSAHIHGGAWSLFDLLSTIFVTLTALYIAFVKKRKKNDEDENKWDEFDVNYYELEESRFKKLKKSKLLPLIFESIMVIILLLITQDFTQPMIIFDQYSIAFALSVILSIIIVKIANKKARDNDRKQVIEEKKVEYKEELIEDEKKLRNGKIAALITDILLIIALLFVTRDGISTWFTMDMFTIIFILCLILIPLIILISNDIDEKDVKEQIENLEN